MKHSLAGVHAAAVTPLSPDGMPDLDAIPGLLGFLARRGCHGVLLLGTTGEGPSFSVDERRQIMAAGVSVRVDHPDLCMLAGTGTPSLSESVDLTRHAFDLGYDGVVVLPPYYYRKANAAGMFNWFNELLCKAVPADGALLWYHIPGLTGIPLHLDLVARLKDAHPGRFAGLKDSSHEVEFARSLGERFGSDLVVLSGTDSLFQAALENHASGCITAPANLISPDLRCLWDAAQRGEDLSGTQAKVSRVRHILEKLPPFPPLLKALLARRHGFPTWRVRPPLEEVDPVALEQAWHELEGSQ